MIVCGRCQHVNRDGALLCEACKTYLGWSRPAASPDSAEDATVPAEVADGGDAAFAEVTATPDVTATPEVTTMPEVDEGDADEGKASDAFSAAPSYTDVRAEYGACEPGQVSAPVTITSVPFTPTSFPSPAGNRPAGVQVTGAAAAPPRQVPIRTIGVRVAPTPIRVESQGPSGTDAETPDDRSFASEAVRPAEASSDLGDVVDGPSRDSSWPSTTAMSFEDAVRCPSCGRGLPVTRRFCRCGATLPPRATLQVGEGDESSRGPRRTWLGGGLRGGRAFRGRMRAANNGVPVRFAGARSAQVYVARATALLGVLGIGAVFALPGTAQVRERVFAGVASLDPRGYTVLPVASVTTDPEVDPEVGFAVEQAVDGTSDRAWAAVWTPPADAGAACQRPGGAAHLRLTLDAAAQVDTIAFAAGLPESSPDRLVQDLPHRVDVIWGDEEDECRTFELAPEAGLQSFDLDAKGVTDVTIVVVDVYESAHPAEVRHVALSEVMLVRRDALGGSGG